MRCTKKRLSHACFIFFINIFVFSFSNQQMPTSYAEILQAAHDGNIQAFEQLIKNKKNVNIKDEKGNTPLHIAAKKGHAELVKMLITYDQPQGYFDRIWQFIFGSNSPDINAQNSDGDTPTHCAIDNDDKQGLVILMCKNPDLSITNKGNCTPLLFAAQKGKEKKTLYLMRMDDNYYKETINGDTILHVAFNRGDYSLAKKIIILNNLLSKHCPGRSGSNALIKTKNTAGETPLLYCARTSNSEMVDVLLENGASCIIDIPDKKERMPISYACYNNNVEMVTALAKNNAAMNTSATADAMPIHITLNNNNYSLAQHLLSLGADINAQEIHYGNSQLLVATEKNDEQKIKWLIDHKADITKRNKKGMDILDIAIVNKYKNLIPVFNACGAKIDFIDQQGKTRLMNAFATGNNDMIEPLIALQANINHKDKNGNTVLHVATEGNNLEGAKIALRYNKNFVHEKNSYGNTALHKAADNAQSSDFVELYIMHAEIDAQNIYGETSLHRATAAGNKKSIELLKKNKASLSLVTKKNNTLAHYALIHAKYDCLPLVLDAHTINIFNVDGKSVLSLAIEKNLSEKMLQKIIEYGVDLTVSLPTKDGGSYVHHAILHHHDEALGMLAIPSLINKENNYHTTALSYAVQQQNRWAVKHLLGKKAKLNVADDNGWTEMHHAAAMGDDYIFDMLPFSEIAYTKRTNKGNTPLHIAAQYNRLNVINLICKNDNNYSRKNDNGETPVMTAAFSGQQEAMLTLLQESDFMDGTVESMLQKMRILSFSSVRVCLEKELEKWNNECNAIITMQSRIENLLRINHTSDALLKQKAIKEYADYKYFYNPSSAPLSYSFEQLKTMSRVKRSEQESLLQQAIQREQKARDILHQKIEAINSRQKKAESELERSTTPPQNTGTTTTTTTTTIQPVAATDDKQEIDETECDLCNEIKKDAQHRCTCEQCDKKICLMCIKAWQEKGKSTCPYCFNELKK